MKHFARLRRTTAVLALSALAVTALIGFAHAFQPAPDYSGGLATPAAVQPVHQTDPNYSGG